MLGYIEVLYRSTGFLIGELKKNNKNTKPPKLTIINRKPTTATHSKVKKLLHNK
jgi:hypothetical protein